MHAILSNFLDSGFITDQDQLLCFFFLFPKFYIDKWNKGSDVCLPRRNLTSAWSQMTKGLLQRSNNGDESGPPKQGLS